MNDGKSLSLFQEPKVVTFKDSNAGFGEDFKSNGFSSDPFTGGFDSGFNARSGFDDSFGNSFPNRADAFGVSGSDPFGDKRGGIPAVTPDVRAWNSWICVQMRDETIFSFSQIKTILAVIHSPYYMHQHRLVKF